MPSLRVHYLPALAAPEQFAGRTVVVIDVLRASTTIAQALQAGAREVIPCREVEEARKLCAEYPGGACISGGERGGLRIEGFELGNSPCEYAPATVGGRTVVFTTTNGTAAMRRAQAAQTVLVGAFVTLSATADALAASNEVDLLCAGTCGEITGEDVLFAGALAEQWLERIWSGRPEQGERASQNALPAGVALNDSARIAVALWRAVRDSGRPLADYLATETAGGRNLMSLGLGADIEFAARIDFHSFVPKLDLAAWRITRG